MTGYTIDLSEPGHPRKRTTCFNREMPGHPAFCGALSGTAGAAAGSGPARAARGTSRWTHWRPGLWLPADHQQQPPERRKLLAGFVWR
jgi:hypothetical protein